MFFAWIAYRYIWLGGGGRITNYNHTYSFFSWWCFQQDANDLEDKYNDVASQLDAKYNETRQAKDRADRLRDRAAKLYQDTYEKIERLRGIYLINYLFFLPQRRISGTLWISISISLVVMVTYHLSMCSLILWLYLINQKRKDWRAIFRKNPKFANNFTFLFFFSYGSWIYTKWKIIGRFIKRNSRIK